MNRSIIKKIIKKIVPLPIFRWINKLYVKLFAHFFNKRDLLTVQRYEASFVKEYGLNVIDGPFAPMKYVHMAVGSAFLHKLAGYYEAVLHPYVNEVGKMEIKNILDIGSAEGYYTTGFGKMFTQASIVAFEMEEDGRRLIQEMYSINNLSNPIEILGEATNENILQYIRPNTLLICDCEGAEKDILSIKNLDVLKNVAYGIIELHDDFVPGCKEACISYFKDTHDIEIVKFTFADVNKFKFLKNISNKNDVSLLLKERGLQDQEWLILRLK